MFSKKSKSQSWSPNKALKDDPEQVKRLSNLLKIRSEHEQTIAKTGWDSYQRELVSIFTIIPNHFCFESIIYLFRISYLIEFYKS
jgi:hypothetical protein